eukprot:3610779-Amphidinium_carterae.1
MAEASRRAKKRMKEIGALAPRPEQVPLPPRGLPLSVLAERAESEESLEEDDEPVLQGAASEHTSLTDPLVREDPWYPLLSRSESRSRRADDGVTRARAPEAARHSRELSRRSSLLSGADVHAAPLLGASFGYEFDCDGHGHEKSRTPSVSMQHTTSKTKGVGSGSAGMRLDQSGVSSDTKRFRGGKPPDPPPLDLTFTQAAADPLLYRQWRKRLQAWQVRIDAYAPKQEHALMVFERLGGDAALLLQEDDVLQYAADNGMDLLLDRLNGAFDERPVQRIGATMKEYEQLRRSDGEQVRAWTARFLRAEHKMMRAGLQPYTGQARGHKYLHGMGLGAQEMRNVLTAARNSYVFEDLRLAAELQFPNQAPNVRGAPGAGGKSGRGGGKGGREALATEVDVVPEQEAAAVHATEVGDVPAEAGDEDAMEALCAAAEVLSVTSQKLKAWTLARGWSNPGKGKDKGQGKGNSSKTKPSQPNVPRSVETRGALAAVHATEVEGEEGADAPDAGWQGWVTSAYSVNETSEVATTVLASATSETSEVATRTLASENETSEVATTVLASENETSEVATSETSEAATYVLEAEPVNAVTTHMVWQAEHQRIEKIDNGIVRIWCIVDTACQRSVTSVSWRQALERELGTPLSHCKESERFKFGCGGALSMRRNAIGTQVHGNRLVVYTSEVPLDIPPLMSRPAMEALGIVLDLGDRRAVLTKLDDQPEVPLCLTHGHLALQFDVVAAECSQVPTSSVKEVSVDGPHATHVSEQAHGCYACKRLLRLPMQCPAKITQEYMRVLFGVSLPVCPQRTNISSSSLGMKFRSVTLGAFTCRGVGITNATHVPAYRELLNMIHHVASARRRNMRIPYLSVSVNEGSCPPHTDNNADLTCLLVAGEFSGGELMVDSTPYACHG